jgi:Spy/CpxP family protein refolding chaperone
MGISQPEKEIKIIKKMGPMHEKMEITEDMFIERALFIAKLKLTEDQEKQFKKMHLELEKKQTDAQAKVRTANIELKELFTADNLDKTAIDKKIKEIAELKTKLHLNRLDHWFAINKILKPEQQKIWRERLENKQLFGKMDARFGDCPCCKLILLSKSGFVPKWNPIFYHYFQH